MVGRFVVAVAALGLVAGCSSEGGAGAGADQLWYDRGTDCEWW